ncbi:MAG: hypothetical protein KBD01_11105 [Acidobacteria bacterium]|nr:hypothetical protein [Acidobacteriota bacterium]
MFTDADVVFAPGTLRRALAHGLAERLDFLAASPEIRRTTFWADIAKGAFGVEFLLWMRPHRAGDPASGAFIGVGAFNLVRRAALERTPGFAWLRMEVADDIGLGLMLKRSGARCGFVVGIDAIATDWYAGLGDVLRGLEKNLFGGAVRYSYARLALLGALYAAFALGLALALSGAAGPWALGLALGAAALHAVLSVVGARLARAPVLEGLLLPVGTVFVGIALLRSAWRCWRQGGITWRGTFYPLAELRAGRRVALGP